MMAKYLQTHIEIHICICLYVCSYKLVLNGNCHRQFAITKDTNFIRMKVAYTAYTVCLLCTGVRLHVCKSVARAQRSVPK